MIVPSMLTEVQFQSENGLSWILADGRSVTGSRYASITGSSTIPDLRGMVLRGKNNGRSDGNQDPDGERSLGSFQNHAINSHNHGGGSHSLTMPVWRATVSLGPVAGARNTNGAIDGNPSTSGPNTTVVQTEGGNETRMRNMAVNYFIKINP